MYSTPAVECCSQSSDEVIVRVLSQCGFHFTTASCPSSAFTGGTRTRMILGSLSSCTPNTQSERISKRTNEVGESEVYGALPLSYGATSCFTAGFAVLQVAPMGFEPTTPGS